MPSKAKAVASDANPLVSEGNKAPDFTLDISGKGTVSLKDFAGKALVLYFYPKDDTPGCTMEAKDFKEHIKDFEKAGVQILGVSKDPLKNHDKFQEKYCLPFPLGSDEAHNTCETYGVWVEKNMYGKKYMGVERATFLIDASGTVKRIWSKVKVDGHVKEVLDAVKTLA